MSDLEHPFTIEITGNKSAIASVMLKVRYNNAAMTKQGLLSAAVYDHGHWVLPNNFEEVTLSMTTELIQNDNQVWTQFDKHIRANKITKRSVSTEDSTIIAQIRIEKLSDIMTITSVNYVTFNDLFIESGAMHTSVFGIFFIIIYLFRKINEQDNLEEVSKGAKVEEIMAANYEVNVYSL